VARLVIAKFRLGRGIAVLADLDADVLNDAGARCERGDPE
jgi:hypothetical protein